MKIKWRKKPCSFAAWFSDVGNAYVSSMQYHDGWLCVVRVRQTSGSETSCYLYGFPTRRAIEDVLPKLLPLIPGWEEEG